VSKKKIIPIVEGYGEEEAVPVLLARWLQHRGFHPFFEVPERAVNAKGCGKLKARYDRQRHLGIEHYVEAALRDGADAIVVILDADEECLSSNPDGALGPRLLARARAVTDLPLSVVVANREYEAWFLANLRTLRARGHFLPAEHLRDPHQPEVPGDCKGLTARLMGVPRYEERVHQKQLTASIGFRPGVARRAPSFGKLLRDLERITRETRQRSAA
jgi:hypothetical protein